MRIAPIALNYRLDMEKPDMEATQIAAICAERRPPDAASAEPNQVQYVLG